MEEKKYKSDLEMVREGSILKEYNIKKNFVNVTPAPTIGKVKISIVALNSGGKDYTDFYLDIEEFRQFCVEIENGIAQKKIMADNNQYPSAYKWTAGNNGCRHFNIGKGRAGVVFQVQNTSKKQNKMVAVTPHSLKKMAFLFRLLMGLVPVTPKTYYSNLIYEFYVNEAKRSSYYKKDIQNGDFDANDSLDAPGETHAESGQQAQSPLPQQPTGQDDPFTGRNNQTIRIHLQFLMTTVRNQIRSFREQTGLPDGGKTRKRKIKQAGVSASLIKKENMTDGKRSKRRKEQQDCGT